MGIGKESIGFITLTVILCHFEMSYLDCLKREIWPKTYKGYYLLEFISDEDEDITAIIWRPDWAIPQG